MKTPRLLTLVFGYACLLSACSAEKAVQKSSSMEPTIKRGETIEVDSTAYSAATPARWEVIVFSSPIGSGEFCSRVIGLPGDVIDLTAAGLTIDGRPASPPKVFKMPAYKLPDPNVKMASVSLPFTVPKDCCFVMGDNVKNSLDSRFWGGLDIKKIRGKVKEK